MPRKKERSATLTWETKVLRTTVDPETLRYPVERSLWLRVPVEDWTIGYRIGVADRRPIIVEVRITSEGSPAQVPSRVLDAVKPLAHLAEHFGPIVAEVRRQQGEDVVFAPTGGLSLPAHGITPEVLDAVSGRGGRPGYSDAYYAGWAAFYVTACQEAPGRPIAWMVERLASEGRPGLGDRYVRDQVRGARDRKLLTDPVGGPRGTGGLLTPLAEEILADHEATPKRRARRK